MNMREQIARAIEARLEPIIVDAVRNCGEGTGPYPQDYRDAVDAALDILSEPTEEMMVAGNAADLANGGPHGDGTVRDVWTAMLTAARSGQ